jgi:coenzyme F420-0:L-glutamate ligase/coenzyme F420-1:gamma-L-glutamate ligase
MPEFAEVLTGRRSHRRFRPEAVDDHDLRTLAEAAAWAPCAGNRRDWKLVAVRDPAAIRAAAAAVATAWEALAAAAGGAGEEVAAYAGSFSWFAEAPALLALCARATPAWLAAGAGAAAARIAGHHASAAMAAQNLLLAAEARGLGACILTGPVAAEPALRTILALPRRHELTALIAIGHPAGEPPVPSRPPLDDLLEIRR